MHGANQLPGYDSNILVSPTGLRPLGATSESNHQLQKWQDVATERKHSFSQDDASVASTMKQSVRSGPSSTGVADIFSPEIFQVVLHNPTTSHQLLRYSQSRFCGENMEFLEKVGWIRRGEACR